MDIQQKIECFREYIRENHLDQLLLNLNQDRLCLDVDFTDILRNDPSFAELILDNPSDSIKIAEVAMMGIDTAQDGVGDVSARLRIRLKNLPKSSTVRIRDIRSHHIDKLVCIEGVVKSKTDVRPLVTSSRYECPSCGNVIPVLQTDNVMREPTRCGCGRKGKFKELSKEKCDAQSVVLEEDLSEIGEDTQPKKLNFLLKDDLTSPERNMDLLPLRPVRMIGIIREMPIMKNRQKTTSLDIYVDVNNFELIEDGLQRIVFSKADIKVFKKLAKDHQLLTKLKDSVAPHIAGRDIIKEAVLLFIVKGVKKESPDGTIKTRDFFHVLLVGDPSTGKSEFGKEVNSLSYKSKRAVGRGASGVGLTASAERDELLGVRVLTAGTIPMCNDGHVVIDEVDKQDDEVQSHLLDCMEDGIITVNKSNVDGRLKANVGIFMVANPKLGRFDRYSPVAGQITLSQPLISRFDLIFPIYDIPNEESDAMLVDAIISKHRDIGKTSQRPIDYVLLRKYLCYVSRHLKPKLTDEAVEEVRQFAMGMRNGTNGNGYAGGKMVNGKKPAAIAIAARQIESPIRLAEAYAKLRMSDKVERQDVQRSIKIIKTYLKDIAFDEETGRIDIDKISTGISSRERESYSIVKKIIENTYNATNDIVPIEEVVKVAAEKGISEASVDKAIEKLKKENEIYEPRSGSVQPL